MVYQKEENEKERNRNYALGEQSEKSRAPGRVQIPFISLIF